MSAWVVWAIAAVLLTVGEILTPGLFFLGPVALAALAGGVASLAGAGVAVQLIVFAVAALASLGVLRPIARAHLRMPRAIRTGAAALEGAHAIVLQRVDLDGGRVRIGGEEWSARAYMAGETYEPGDRVEVVKIEGATALVYQ